MAASESPVPAVPIAATLPSWGTSGKEASHQNQSSTVGNVGYPIITSPLARSSWYRPEDHDPQPTCMGAFSACCGETYQPPIPDGQLWKWNQNGKLRLACEQPVVPVPVIQEIHRRDKIIEIPQVDVVDAVKPKVFNQGVEHEVPRMHVKTDEQEIEIPRIKYVETEVIVPIVTGYTHKFVPKWEVREVPRPVVKYVGEQEVIEVDVPQVQFVDKVIEREVVVDTVEKKVPKIIEIPKYVDQVQYVWKKVEKIVHVERFVPKFDVSLECPAPLIVPYPVQQVKEMPSIMVRKNPGEISEREIDVDSPSGTVRVPDEYIREYYKSAREGRSQGGATLICNPLAPCMQQEVAQKDNDGNEFMRRMKSGNLFGTENLEQREQAAVIIGSGGQAASTSSFNPFSMCSAEQQVNYLQDTNQDVVRRPELLYNSEGKLISAGGQPVTRGGVLSECCGGQSENYQSQVIDPSLPRVGDPWSPPTFHEDEQMYMHLQTQDRIYLQKKKNQMTMPPGEAPLSPTQ